MTQSSRAGFTLLELVIVIGIIAVLAGFVLAALGTGLSSARDNQTKAVLAILDGVLAEREQFYESQVIDSGRGLFRYFNTSSRNSEFSTKFAQVNGALPPSSSIYFVQRKLYASVFPQTFRDLCGFDGRPGIPDGASGLPAGVTANDDRDPSDPVPDPDTDFVTTASGAVVVDLKELGIGGRHTDDPPTAGVIRRALASVDLNLAAHNPATESSEVLYLCLTNEIVPGMAVLNADDVPPGFTTDSDGDGLLEFVDGWDQPLRFYAFTSGLFRPDPWTWGTGTAKTAITLDQSAFAASMAGRAIKITPGPVASNDRTSSLNRDPKDRFDSVRRFDNNGLGAPSDILGNPGFGYAIGFVVGSDQVPDAPGLPITFGTPSFSMIVSAGPDERLGLGEPTNTDGTQYATPTDVSAGYDNLTSLQGRRR